ncbi:MAG: IclR family transcriptional regulator [Mesorhizobium sp.]|nr:MAG: IclR family transcriptional regulator [Mesorhizobium sp.]TGP88080.1 IclR family transcriptional regulator [Mesorhizobium sp. M8A.F.Ca.ET.218.01.1.1]TGT15841.1 IclR family transcriptional regulator [Mesorhizobium sp. M8A.F.Ca.ET.213.01.1.1]
MVQSVAKAFKVLQAFDAQHPAMTLSEIAQQADLDLSAAQRFAHTLQQLGYLLKHPGTRQFSLSLKSLDLAYHYRLSSQLVNRAMPVLHHVSKETEETVNLTVLDGTEVVYLERIQSRHVLATNVTTGTRLPAYCLSPGRAILSRLPNDIACSVIAASDLVKHTSHTETDPDRLIDLIEAARQQGYAACFEELYHGDASIAAPILGPDSQAIGAISIATTLSRFSREEVVERYAKLIISAARSVSAY